MVNTEQGAFLSKLNTTGTALAYSTFLGGGSTSGPGSVRFATGVAADAAGNAYVAGFADSYANFPTTPGVLQPTFVSTVASTYDRFVAKVSSSPPVCQVAAVLPGPPAQLQVAVHADRGLSKLAVTSATNATVAVPTFAPGAVDAPMVTATKLDQTRSASVTLLATDQSGTSTSCDPALLAVGRAPGDSPAQVLRHLAQGESHLTVIDGTPGIDRLRIDVNGHRFVMQDLQDGQSQTLDVSSAMRKGTRNTLLVVAHGPRDSSAVVIVSDSPN
jgi:hypothetical protein